MADMEELFGSSDNESRVSDKGDSDDNDEHAADSDKNEGGGDDDRGSNADSADSENAGVSDEEDGNAGNDTPVSPGESGKEAAESDDQDDDRQSEASRASGSDEEPDAEEREASEREDAGSDAEQQQQPASENEEAGSDNDEKPVSSEDEENAPAGSDNEGRSSDNDVASGSEAAGGTDVENNEAGSGSDDDEEGQNKSQSASGAEEESEKEGAGSEEDSPVESENEVEAPKPDPDSDDDGQQSQHSDADQAEEAEAMKSDAEQVNEDDDDSRPGENATAEALFGDADDISSASDAEGKEDKALEHGSEQGTPRDDEIQDEMDENEEEQPEEIPETRIDVEIPKINTDLGREIHFVKLPNFFSVETRPFDHQTYEDEIDEDEVLDEEGRARLKLKVENTVRWRWGFDTDANPVKESNARVIKWSDGSMSLHLGSEIFDVHKQLLQGDHNHLFIRQGTGLQGQAVFRTKLTFRPHSTDSFTHRKITMSVADRSQKTQKIRILPNVGQDPEAHRSEMIKKEEDRLKASIRRESKQRRMRERALSRGLSSSYLESERYEDEDEDDDGAISLAAIKNRYKRGALREARPPIYSSDSEGSDINDGRARRLERAKALAESDEEMENDSEPKKKVARIQDSEDEDDD